MMKSVRFRMLAAAIFATLSIVGFAQGGDTLQAGGIVQDERVDQLVQKHIKINEAIGSVDGFRLQVYSESGANSKNKAQAALDEFKARFPDTPAYLSFKSPNYRVRVGDFRSRLDAQRFLIGLTADYPNAFIIEDKVNIPNAE